MANPVRNEGINLLGTNGLDQSSERMLLEWYVAGFSWFPGQFLFLDKAWSSNIDFGDKLAIKLQFKVVMDFRIYPLVFRPSTSTVSYLARFAGHHGRPTAWYELQAYVIANIAPRTLKVELILLRGCRSSNVISSDSLSLPSNPANPVSVEITIHTLLCVRQVYPPSTFVRRRSHGCPVYQSRHPQLRQYISDVTALIGKEMEKGMVRRVTIVIKGIADGLPRERFLFDLGYMALGIEGHQRDWPLVFTSL
jgi:hypothetical protein